MKKKSNEAQKSLSSKKKFAFTIVLILLLIFITFLVAEIYIRLTKSYVNLWVVTGREVGIDPKDKWALVDAFSAYKGRPGYYRKTKKTINKYGFISTPEISVEKPENTIRVVFLGGSAAAGGTGRNSTDENTWPFIVTEILKKNLKEKRIEFINAALGGYTTFESFGRLWSRVRFFSPDIIVVYHGWNEMYYFNGKEADKIAYWRTLPDGSWGFHNASRRTIYEPHWIDFLIRHSQLLTKIRLRISKVHSEEISVSKELKNDYDKRGLEIFRTNLQLIKAASSIFNVKLFVVKQATLIVPDLAEKDRERCHYDYHGFDHNAHVDAFNQIYRIIDEEIDSENIIDATRLSGTSDYFYDHIHLTELGSKEIAKIVAKSLQSYLVALEEK
jgi:hypothetical protein